MTVQTRDKKISSLNLNLEGAIQAPRQGTMYFTKFLPRGFVKTR